MWLITACVMSIPAPSSTRMCHAACPVFEVWVMTPAPVAREASAAALNNRSAGSFGSRAVPTLITPQRMSVPSAPCSSSAIMASRISSTELASAMSGNGSQ